MVTLHRQAIKGDQRYLVQLISLYFKELAGFSTGSTNGEKQKNPELTLLDSLPIEKQGNTFYYYVTLKDDRIVAAALVLIKKKIFFKNLETAYIDLAITSPGERRKGIMTSLFRYIKTDLRKRKIYNFELNVVTNNKAALKFWKKQGFQNESVNMKFI